MYIIKLDNKKVCQTIDGTSASFLSILYQDICPSASRVEIAEVEECYNRYTVAEYLTCSARATYFFESDLAIQFAHYLASKYKLVDNLKYRIKVLDAETMTSILVLSDSDERFDI